MGHFSSDWFTQPFVFNLEVVLVLLAGSLVGGLHCAGMCGPLASVNQSKSNIIFYHIGRWVSYACAGLTIGLLSKSIGQYISKEIQLGLQIVAVLVMIALALSVLFPSKVRLGLKGRALQKLSGFAFQIMNRIPLPNSFLMGLFTALLPCGYLYGFLGVVFATQSPEVGLALMTLFWIGTVPSLLGIQVFLGIKKLPRVWVRTAIAVSLLFSATLFAGNAWKRFAHTEIPHHQESKSCH
ncbi:MAG: hypothetical protein CL677_02665 [Bdellovibrionaceae bacterium]|nr:hypothetical protein [Pseudobdellovibrionaceae bacterium]